ncbi:putative lipid II flippase FtsW [Halalkalibacter akibai]|uniref:Probable peptidoglycan glycosyltransferase FtsW n=1 Tax=Halalkalibacter akibai (strain ATCC 43226 / DSM 21942 / CIP 109018 / JCM 9157 / 1139) TaxID=1236973 RepID=W4QS91_HALA3|nr:putative lipid II flippase FtsW [Halalkalibacter akibai]GAE34209.1 cell division protein FtsW [Halalkalibacter akibai JCM 9157]
MKYSFRKDNDWLLIFTTFLLAIFGLVMVFSASYALGIVGENPNPYAFIQRQIVWFGLAAFAFLVVMHVPYRLYRNLSPIIIILSVLALFLVLTPFLGRDINGAQRWIDLKVLVVQPSEFVKLGMIIYLAQVYSQKQAYIDQFIRGVMPPLVVVGIVFGLIMMQPDLGTATSILLVTLMIVFFSGAKWRHLIGLAAVGVSLFVVFALSAPYRVRRLTSFQDPFADPTGTGFHVIQSYIAMAHGGISGTGLGQSVQKLFYLPEAHTDFILAVVSEELGLFGVLFVLGAHTLIITRGVMIGTRCKNPFGSLLAFGIVFQIAIQIIFNVGAVTGMLPITGIPLPLVSNGGSSLFITLVSLAILANISRNNIRQNRQKEYKEETQLSAS